MPATCHSLTSRYSLIASAARNERLRPVFLAHLSSRFLALASTRTVKVVERMISVSPACLCTIWRAARFEQASLECFTHIGSVMPDDDHSPISASDAKRLFANWKAAPAIVLAVSGGPDSVALMWLAARWRRAMARGPRLVAVTVDHGLRAEAAAEARDVKRLGGTPEPAARNVG